jgi:hypothetical protein
LSLYLILIEFLRVLTLLYHTLKHLLFGLLQSSLFKMKQKPTFPEHCRFPSTGQSFTQLFAWERVPILSTKHSGVVCIRNEDDGETPHSTCFQTRVSFMCFLHVALMCEHLTFLTPILYENLSPLLWNYHHEASIINPSIDYFFTFVLLKPTMTLLVKSLYVTSLFKTCYNFAVILSHTTFETLMLSAMNTSAFWSYSAAMHCLRNI